MWGPFKTSKLRVSIVDALSIDTRHDMLELGMILGTQWVGTI